MKFEEVLPLLREGKKARHTGCVAGSYYFIRDRRIWYYMASTGEEAFTTMSGCEIVDDDWEIVN